MTLLHRTAKPDDEDDDFIPDLRDSIIEAIQKPGITRRRYIVFQATPSYSHLVSDPIFLRESIDRAVKTAGYRIDAVEAVGVVIDSIPKTISSPYSEGWSIMITDRKMKFYGDTTAAYQNFEFTPAPMADIPTSPQPKFPTFGASRNPDDDRGSFQLIFQTPNTDFTPSNNKQKIISRRKERLYIKTKMANTLFQNGMPSTAMVHKYRVDGDEDGSNARLYPLLVNRTKDLTVQLNGGQVWEARVNYCLRNLTGPRKVYQGVGNIIKKLRGPDGIEIMNGSQELEAAVADVTLKRPIYDPVTFEKRPLEIFARIAPDDSKGLGGLGQRIPEKGVRIAKVLAGGGGWGLNAGILALDPEVIQGYRPPELLEGYLKELGDSGPTDIREKWVTFFYSDPMKSTARGRKDSSLGQWKFTMVGKGDTIGPDTKHPDTNLPSEPTATGAVEETAIDSKDTVPQNPTEEASQQDVAPAPEEVKPPKKPNFPAQILQTGADTALWINGQKLDIPMFSIMLDLLAEIGESEGTRIPIRWVGRLTKKQQRYMIIKDKRRKRPQPGLTLMGRTYPFEGKTYEAEIQKARSYGNDDTAMVEGEDEGKYQEALNSSGISLGELKESITGPEILPDRAEMIRELERLHKQQGRLVEGEAGPDVVLQETDGQAVQKDDSVSSQPSPSEPIEQINGLNASDEKSTDPKPDAVSQENNQEDAAQNPRKDDSVPSPSGPSEQLSGLDVSGEKPADSELGLDKKMEKLVEEEEKDKPETGPQETKESSQEDSSVPAKEA